MELILVGWFFLTLILTYGSIRLMGAAIHGLSNTKLVLYSRAVSKANYGLFLRYRYILEEELAKKPIEDEDFSNVLKLCQLGLDHIKQMPVDKQSRWVGYIQRALKDYGLLDLESERNFTRVIFHEIYLKHNMSTVIRDVADLKLKPR